VIAGFGPRGELPLPLSSPSPPLPSPLRAFPARPLWPHGPRIPCPRGPGAPRPRPCPGGSSPRGPAASRPRPGVPGGPAPRVAPRRRLGPAASRPRLCAPHAPTAASAPRCPRPGGPAILRPRAPAPTAPATPCPGVASRAPTRLTCPRRAQHFLAHATIAARRSTFSLIRFSLF
jgi:translation initiation factor IF-2